MSQIQEQLPQFERHARALEKSTCRQIQGKFKDGKGGLCAVAIIAKEFGWDEREGIYAFLDRTEFIDSGLFSKVHWLNDCKNMTKQQIAEWLREQK